MTVSEQQARPPDNPPPGDEWKQVPGYSRYKWSHRGKVLSLRQDSIMKQRPNNSGYLVVNVVNDDGKKETVLVHRMILRAHAGEFEPWEESLHGPGGQQDNRFPENLCKGTRAQNVAERVAANPAQPKEPARCINHERCGGYVVQHGRRCHGCRVELGHAAALLFEGGADPEQVAKALNYGSANGAYRLAIQFGGGRFVIDEASVTPHVVTQGNEQPKRPWLRRVIIAAQAWLADSDAQ